MPLTKRGWRFGLSFAIFPLLSISNGLLAQSSQRATLGSVEGLVLGPQDRPIVGADVYALPEQDMRRPVGSATTDSSGKFVLRDLPPVVVYVYAYKESDGYPNTFARFFEIPGDRALVSVKVESGQIATGVTLKRSAKAARLKVTVTNESGSPVAGYFVFTREDQLGDYTMGARNPNGGEESILVPPLPFRLTIGADGYVPWHYGGVNWTGKEGLISLKSDETLDLAVQLHKK